MTLKENETREGERGTDEKSREESERAALDPELREGKGRREHSVFTGGKRAEETSRKAPGPQGPGVLLECYYQIWLEPRW